MYLDPNIATSKSFELALAIGSIHLEEIDLPQKGDTTLLMLLSSENLCLCGNNNGGINWLLIAVGLKLLSVGMFILSDIGIMIAARFMGMLDNSVSKFIISAALGFEGISGMNLWPFWLSFVFKMTVLEG